MTDRRDPEHTRIGILTTDTELIVRSWDAALAHMTGITAAAAIGQRLDELVPDLRARSLMDALREPLLSGSPVVLAPALHHYFIPCAPLEPSAEFDRMQQRVVIGALKNDQETIGVVVTIEDVTARLERERRLAKQLRDVDPAHRLEAVAQLAADEHADRATLTPAITDDDWRVRRAAVKAMSRTRNATLVGAVVAALRDGHTNFSFLSSALQLLTLSGVDLTDALIELLRDPDPDLRLQAALALGTQRNATAAEALVAALDDPAPNVRFHAIEALGTLASPAALERLMNIAESGDFFLAFPAIEALVRINDPIVAARLVPLLPDPLLGGVAADALGQLGDENAIEPLVTALGTPEIPIVPVVSAIAAIHKRYGRLFGGAEEIEDRVRQAMSPLASRRILDALLQTSATPLRDLVTAVGWLADPSVPAALARFLSSHDASHDVIEALVRFGESAVDALIAQLGQDDADTRRASAIALGRIGDRRSVPPLIALLEEDGRDVRLPAIAALGKIGDSRGFLPLLALLGDPDTGIRQAAIGALNSLGHRDMEGHILTLLQSPDARVRESAVKIAGYFGYPACVEMFLERCRDAHESVRCAALEHLPYFEDHRTLDVLSSALAGETPRARAAATQALGMLSDPVALELLRRVVTDNDPWVRYFAAIGLGRQRDEPAVTRLIETANGDTQPHVRVAAIEALGAIGAPRALGALEALAGDGDPEVCHAAMRVLGRLHWTGAGKILTEALRSSETARRLVAVEALTAWGDHAAVEPLRWTAAADSDPSVAAAALAGLVSIANSAAASARDAVSALVALAGDPDNHNATVAAIGQLQPATIPWLSNELDAVAAPERAAVVDGLARILHPAATACLERALNDGDDGVRRHAIRGLSRIGTRRVATRLADMARHDPSDVVRQEAAAALRRGDHREERDGSA